MEGIENGVIKMEEGRREDIQVFERNSDSQFARQMKQARQPAKLTSSARLNEAQLERPNATCPDFDVASLRCAFVERELGSVPPALALCRLHRRRHQRMSFPLLSAVSPRTIPPRVNHPTGDQRAKTHRGLPPEQEQLLGCRELLRVHLHFGLDRRSLWHSDGRVNDAGFEEDERNRCNAAAVGFERTVAPRVFPFEAAVHRGKRSG
jgi:hypothetical protein